MPILLLLIYISIFIHISTEADTTINAITAPLVGIIGKDQENDPDCREIIYALGPLIQAERLYRITNNKPFYLKKLKEYKHHIILMEWLKDSDNKDSDLNFKNFIENALKGIYGMSQEKYLSECNQNDLKIRLEDSIRTVAGSIPEVLNNLNFNTPFNENYPNLRNKWKNLEQEWKDFFFTDDKRYRPVEDVSKTLDLYTKNLLNPLEKYVQEKNLFENESINNKLNIIYAIRAGSKPSDATPLLAHLIESLGQPTLNLALYFNSIASEDEKKTFNNVTKMNEEVIESSKFAISPNKLQALLTESGEDTEIISELKESTINENMSLSVPKFWVNKFMTCRKDHGIDSCKAYLCAAAELESPFKDLFNDICLEFSPTGIIDEKIENSSLILRKLYETVELAFDRYIDMKGFIKALVKLLKKNEEEKEIESRKKL